MVVSEELLISASCLLRPMSKNSVFEEFSVRRFAVVDVDVEDVLAQAVCLYASFSDAAAAAEVRRVRR